MLCLVINFTGAASLLCVYKIEMAGINEHRDEEYQWEKRKRERARKRMAKIERMVDNMEFN